MTGRSLQMLACALTLSLVLAGRAAADEILFLNGDRLTGRSSAPTAALTIKSETAGEVTVDLAKVKTFSTDEPIVDWTPYKTVKLFHNVEWLPNITDWFGDYNLNADVGVRATIYEGLGVGWSF
jgi:hypothetical protein